MYAETRKNKGQKTFNKTKDKGLVAEEAMLNWDETESEESTFSSADESEIANLCLMADDSADTLSKYNDEVTELLDLDNLELTMCDYKSGVLDGNPDPALVVVALEILPEEMAGGRCCGQGCCYVWRSALGCAAV
ncbi:hypothetical protein Droror1_Dr00024744 [Drosera rotundifolia]